MGTRRRPAGGRAHRRSGRAKMQLAEVREDLRVTAADLTAVPSQEDADDADAAERTSRITPSSASPAWATGRTTDS